MKKCVFCKIINGKLPGDIIFEDKNVLVMLDIDDAVSGHVLVIWKRHYLNVSDLSEDEYVHFSRVFHRAERAVLNVVNKKRALVLKVGGIVSHFHFHIYPVDLETNWEEIKNIFDKKVKYLYKEGEKEELIKDLKEELVLD